jgi:hypothetical protein
MATKKNIPVEEKFEKQDLDLFEVLAALDRKDYNYYDKLTEEQQKKFVPYMLTLWMSCIKGNSTLQGYYVMNTEYTANKYLFNENVQKHPKLQWLMLCAASPGIGKQFHQWIPHIRDKVAKLKESAKVKEVKEFYKKIYPKTDEKSLDEFVDAFVEDHKRKTYLAETFPNLKLDDIETLNALVTDEDIKHYERERGN